MKLQRKLASNKINYNRRKRNWSRNSSLDLFLFEFVVSKHPQPLLNVIVTETLFGTLQLLENFFNRDILLPEQSQIIRTLSLKDLSTNLDLFIDSEYEMNDLYPYYCYFIP